MKLEIDLRRCWTLIPLDSVQSSASKIDKFTYRVSFSLLIVVVIVATKVLLFNNALDHTHVNILLFLPLMIQINRGSLIRIQNVAVYSCSTCSHRLWLLQF